MNKDDFYIIRNSITMRQVAEFYGFKLDRKGFMKCPFHGNGSERTPSLQVFPEYRGFQCKGCGQAGDVTKFVQIYENLSPKDSAMVLSERFGVPISENSEIPEEVRQRANKARLERERQIVAEKQKQAEVRQITRLITAYRNIMPAENRMSELYAYCLNKCQYQVYLLEEISRRS